MTEFITPGIDTIVQAAADDLLGGQVARTITTDRAEHVCNRLALQVEQMARSRVLLSLMSTADVAEHFGVSPRRIQARVKWLRARGHDVGWHVPGTRAWLFRPEELPILEPDARYRRKRAAE